MTEPHHHRRRFGTDRTRESAAGMDQGVERNDAGLDVVQGAAAERLRPVRSAPPDNRASGLPDRPLTTVRLPGRALSRPTAARR
jgi:hypothetical protein